MPGGTRPIQRLISWSPNVTLVAVLGLFMAFVALVLPSVWSTVAVVIRAALGDGVGQKELVGTLDHQADTALPAAVFHVIAPGLYSLFVSDEIPLPSWLRIHDLGDLKVLLASIVIVVVAVVFLGFALTWNDRADLLVVGLSRAAAVFVRAP